MKNLKFNNIVYNSPIIRCPLTLIRFFNWLREDYSDKQVAKYEYWFLNRFQKHIETNNISLYLLIDSWQTWLGAR